MFTHTINLKRRPTVDDVRNSSSASYWLKTAMDQAMRRDPLDALKDAEVLTVLLAQRLAEVQQRTN